MHVCVAQQLQNRTNLLPTTRLSVTAWLRPGTATRMCAWSCSPLSINILSHLYVFRCDTNQPAGGWHSKLFKASAGSLSAAIPHATPRLCPTGVVPRRRCSLRGRLHGAAASAGRGGGSRWALQARRNEWHHTPHGPRPRADCEQPAGPVRACRDMGCATLVEEQLGLA
jgi:hypothetical protein